MKRERCFTGCEWVEHVGRHSGRGSRDGMMYVAGS